jgi:hypothetical protein
MLSGSLPPCPTNQFQKPGGSYSAELATMSVNQRAKCIDTLAHRRKFQARRMWGTGEGIQLNQALDDL